MALKPSLDAYAAFIHRLHLRPPPPRSPDLPPPPLHGLTFAVKDMHVLLLVLTSPLLLTPDHYPHWFVWQFVTAISTADSTSVAASPGSATRTGRGRTRQRRPHLPLFSLLSELAPPAWEKLSWTRWHTGCVQTSYDIFGLLASCREWSLFSSSWLEYCQWHCIYEPFASSWLECTKNLIFFFFLFLCSINGENYHYGTPTNPCAPDRVPGGSSSGSAVAVAANLVDFALGLQPTISWSLLIFYVQVVCMTVVFIFNTVKNLCNTVDIYIWKYLKETIW